MMPQTTSTSNARPRRLRRARGFTFIELCFALTILASVMGGVAGLAMATAGAWRATANKQTAVASVAQSSARLGALIRNSKFVLQSASGAGATPMSVFLWTHDGDLAAATQPDAKAQYSELALLQYDSATQTLRLYQAGSGLSSDPQWLYSFLTTASAMTSFKSGLTPSVLLRNVTAVNATVSNAASTTMSPTVTFTLTISDGDSNARIETIAVSLRSPGVAPA